MGDGTSRFYQTSHTTRGKHLPYRLSRRLNKPYVHRYQQEVYYFSVEKIHITSFKAEIWKSVNNSKIQSYKSWQFDWCKRSDSAHRTASFIDYYESIYSAYNRLYLAKHTRTIRLTCNELNPCKRSDVYAKSL